MGYILKEMSKIVPILLFIIILMPNAIGISLCGLYLLIEHMWAYGYWGVKDILGHETFGIVLLVTGLLIGGSYILVILCIMIYLIFGDYGWRDKLKPIPYAWSKIKEVFYGSQ